MTPETAIHTVSDGLKWLAFQLDGRTVARLYDLNIVSENFIKDFLNCLRELSLKNLNDGGANFPAIDLGDKKHRISFQVTTEKRAKKMQESLDTFHRHQLDRDYDQIVFMILGTKQGRYSTIKSPGISFDPTRQIVDINDLIRESIKQSPPRIQELARIIQNAGLSISAPRESDEQAFRKIYSLFDRNALKHRWRQEGPIPKFKKAIDELTELLGKGTVEGQQVTKPIYLFDQALFLQLSGVKHALGDLSAVFNQKVNSKEIRPDDEFAFFKDRESTEAMNAAKQKVIDAINEIATRYKMPPILMHSPGQF
jgi:hypothetical protein